MLKFLVEKIFGSFNFEVSVFLVCYYVTGKKFEERMLQRFYNNEVGITIPITPATCRHIPAERRTRLHSCEDLKTRKFNIILLASNYLLSILLFSVDKVKNFKQIQIHTM
jgi:hypothetical protein